MSTRQRFLMLCAIFIAIGSVHGCSGLFPPIQSYPIMDTATVKAQAQAASDTLEAYIKDWVAGRVPDAIPESVLPQGLLLDDMDANMVNPLVKNIKLARVETLKPTDYTYIRKAKVLNSDMLPAQFPDPHGTYLHTFYLVPFNTTTVMKGKFPHARIFLITVTPPVNALQYQFVAFGSPEVPLVDVDIIPDSGSINPFKVGANRNATNRSYTVKYISKIADWGSAPNQYCPKRESFYRATGNTRWSSGILPKGPGLYGQRIPGKMDFGAGVIWMRYWHVDNYGKPGFDYLAGVGLPTIYHQLATGEKFMTLTDMNSKVAWGDEAFKALTVSNEPDSSKAQQTFTKMWGIFNGVSQGLIRANGWVVGDEAAQKKYSRDLVRGVEGRGADLPAPGNYEGSATCFNYTNYLCNEVFCASGKVMVLTGKMPTFPKTKNGEATMTAGQMRYWSICSNESATATDPNGGTRQPGICTATICDDEVVLDANRNYVICQSRLADKPANATSAAGVTWVDWGPNSDTHWTWRFISIHPDWKFAKTPDEINLTWEKTDWQRPGYDPNIMGNNSRTGWLGEYMPKVNYMDKGCFEKLGTPVTWAKVDSRSWNSTGCCGTPLRGHTPGVLPLIPLFLAVVVIGMYRRKK